MVDFANGNLCGVSLELNSVLSKLSDAKAQINAAIDDPASAAAAAFGAAQNELKALTDKLQTIEIPTLPKLNLQAEILNLTSMIPGSIGHISALAKIALEFGDDIKAKGLTLETIVTAAGLGSDIICTLVPNLEKESGSLTAAIEKPAAVKQAAAPAVTEASSKVWQNPDVEEKVKENEEKVAAHAVTSTPPTKDTGAFTVVPASDVKEISTSSGAVVKSVPAGSGNNTSPDAGFQHKKSKITEKIKFKDIMDEGGGKIIIKTKHTPTEVVSIMMHPPVTYDDNLIVPTVEEKAQAIMKRSSYDKNKFGSPRYKNREGSHMESVFLRTPTTRLPSMLSRKEVVETDVGISFTPPFKTVGNHPGNIVSVPYEFWNGETWVQKKGYYRHTTGKGSDKGKNRMYGGFAAVVSYAYLGNYDADPEVDSAAGSEAPEKTLRSEWAADDRREKKEAAEKAKAEADAAAYAKTPKGIAEEEEEARLAAEEAKEEADFWKTKAAEEAAFKLANPDYDTD